MRKGGLAIEPPCRLITKGIFTHKGDEATKLKATKALCFK
jgi:hypothetical protein